MQIPEAPDPDTVIPKGFEPARTLRPQSVWCGNSYETIPISLNQGHKSIREGDRSHKRVVMLFNEIKPEELGFFVL